MNTNDALNVLNQKVRAVAYLVLILLAPLGTWAASKGYIGVAETSLIATYTAIVGGVALANLKSDEVSTEDRQEGGK